MKLFSKSIFQIKFILCNFNKIIILIINFLPKIISFILIINILFSGNFTNKNYYKLNINYQHEKNSNTKKQKNKIYFQYNLNYNDKHEFIKLTEINYFYSFKFQIIKVEYIFGFFDEYNNLFVPSDLTLYKNLHIICNIDIVNSNISINSLANIYQNSYYKCTEFSEINENVQYGIKIYEIRNEILNYYNTIYFFTQDILNYSKVIYKNDEIFDPLRVYHKYNSLINLMDDKHINSTLKLKNSYISFPYCTLKRFTIINENKWDFKNLFNDYFCICKGYNCLKQENMQKCKYYFYLNIIDNNRKMYNKTDYLFVDFIFNELSSNDAYPIFKKMADDYLPVHYMTENSDIYNKYCYDNYYCLKVIQVNKKNFTINGDFLEKYLTLILKLKQVISGGGIYFNYFNNIFYNIEYITYICISHGISFFKFFLYDDFSCYGHKIYDKLLLPPSNKLISIAAKYGWNDEDIIKMNLPKWDKYNNEEIISLVKDNNIIQNNSIFLMFTWRDIKKKKFISHYYFENLFNLINNNSLKIALKNNNVRLYFALHHRLNNYKYKFINTSFIKIIEENEIFECLSKTNLVITDFSSIIFDLIYRRKPFVIYIPDGEDPNIEDIYKHNYFEIIQSLKNGSITFENKFFKLEEAINKILFYINNNFTLEPKLIEFYNSLNLTKTNNLDNFINYIKFLN